jgi:hypothetical protein
VRTDVEGSPLPDGAIARLGTTRWRVEDGNWLAYVADGKSIYACTVMPSIGIQETDSRTDVIGEFDLRTARERRHFELPTITREPKVPGAFDKTIAAINVPRHLVAFYADPPAGTRLYVADLPTQLARYKPANSSRFDRAAARQATNGLGPPHDNRSPLACVKHGCSKKTHFLKPALHGKRKMTSIRRPNQR